MFNGRTVQLKKIGIRSVSIFYVKVVLHQFVVSRVSFIKSDPVNENMRRGHRFFRLRRNVGLRPSAHQTVIHTRRFASRFIVVDNSSGVLNQPNGVQRICH